MPEPSPLWYLYLIRCVDNTLYTGITTDLDRRFAEHEQQGKKCAKYLRGKAPLTLVFSCPVGTKSEAARLEMQIKKKPKVFKETLIEAQHLKPKAQRLEHFAAIESDSVGSESA